MKTLRLLILFSLVVLGAYVEDKANAEVRGMRFDLQGKDKDDSPEPGVKSEKQIRDLRIRVDD